MDVDRLKYGGSILTKKYFEEQLTLIRKIRLVRILLIYHKSHVPKNQQETFWWRQIIKSEYPGYDII